MAVQVKDSRRCRSKIHGQRWPWSKIHGGADDQRFTAVKVKDSRPTLAQVEDSRRCRSKIHVGACRRFTANRRVQVEDSRRCRSKV